MERFEAPTSDETLQPVDVVKPDLYERLIGSQAIESHLILGED